MFNKKVAPLFLLLSLTILSSAEGLCKLKVGDGVLSRPKIIGYWGSREYVASYDSNELEFFKNERFSAICATQLLNNDNNPIFQNEFICDEQGNITTWSVDNIDVRVNFDIEVSSFKCAAPTLAIYESNSNFDWCKHTDKYGSHSLLINNTFETTQIAEICFQYEKRKPQIIKYFSVPTVYNDSENMATIQQMADLWDNNVSTIELFYDAPNNYSFDNLGLKYFPEKYNFEHNSLVQSGILYSLRNQQTVFDVIWWHNLRVSNWRIYVDALSERSKSSIYKVYAGSSGRVKIPPENPSDIFQIVPEYIWNFLQEENGTEEFVIIGYNSPFVELFDEAEITPCQDICDVIDWLRDIRHYFKYAFYGKMYCCTLEGALRSNILEGFTL